VITRYCPRCWKEVAWEAVRCEACGGELDDGVTFPEKLLRAIHHPEPTRACLAIEILGRLREPRAVEPLLALLATTHDPVMQAEAARSLGAIGDLCALPTLVDLLHNPEAPFMARCAAAYALGDLGGDQALAALQQARFDPRPSVARAAGRAWQRSRQSDSQA
jgi:HEAT repeat protein